MYAQRNRKNSALYIALRNGCEEDLEKILTENPDALFDFKFDYDEPALVRAIGMACSRSIVGILLKHGADPNEWGRQGYSPLTRIRYTTDHPLQTYRLDRPLLQIGLLLISNGANCVACDGLQRHPEDLLIDDFRDYYRFCREAHACILLDRQPHAIFTPWNICVIVSFLVPRALIHKVAPRLAY